MGNSLELIRYLQDQNFLLIMMEQFSFHHQITLNDTKNIEIKRSTLEKIPLYNCRVSCWAAFGFLFSYLL